jgi:Tol biopolymer transport system component
LVIIALTAPTHTSIGASAPRASSYATIRQPMPLTAGTRLGAYEVIALLGSGGMGDVYRARDTRLSRDVAIKILPDLFARDADRRARFEREAQIVASLSHPNIVNVFDTGSRDETLYLVMELLDGETLRARLTRDAALPVKKSTDYGVQMARGLAAAHDKGLVHRDLKPENVYLLHDGQVKILDFGLAKAIAWQPGATADATRTVAAQTEAGTVMGTVGYMAPEQVRGQAVDARADLFALGAVLYEMLSGTPAFKRQTSAETLTAILREDPPELAATRAEIPPALDRIVRHCLEKNPVERFQTARDVGFALDTLSGSGSSAAVSGAVGRPRVGTVRGIALAAAAVGLLAAGALGARLLAPAPQPIQFTTRTFATELITNARFMPDGRTIVYNGVTAADSSQLFELRDASNAPRAFGPQDAHLLAISKAGELAVLINGHRIGAGGYSGTLARMSADAAPRPLAPSVSAADWSPDGHALAVVRRASGMDQLEYPMGTVLFKSSGYLSDIRVSPDGRRVVFMDHLTDSDDRGWLRVVDTAGAATTLGGEFPSELGTAWSTDGRHVFFSATTVGGQVPTVWSVDAGGVQTTPRALTHAVPAPGGMLVADVAPDGSVLVISDSRRFEVGVKLRGQPLARDLSWLDQSWGSSLSDDGTVLLFTDGHGGASYSTVVRRTDGSPIVRLGDGSSLCISPDGNWAISVNLGITPQQLIAYPTGAGDPILLPRGRIETYFPDGGAQWLAGGRSFLIRAAEPTQAPRTYRQSLDGGDPRPVLPANVRAALVSPDGRRVAGLEAGTTWRVYSLDGGAATTMAGVANTDEAVGWTADGRAVIVAPRTGQPARLERVDLTTGARTRIHDLRPPTGDGLRAYFHNVTLDGDQFTYWGTRTARTLYVVSGVRQ